MSKRTSAGIAAMRARNAEHSKWLDERVLTQIAAMLADPDVAPEEICPTRIARVLGGKPTRQTIASKPALVAAIEQARKSKRERLNKAPSAPSSGSASAAGLRAQLKTYASRIEALKSDVAALRAANADLEQQRRLALGAQLEGQTLIDPAEHQRIVADNDSLAARLHDCQAESAALRRTLNERDETIRALRVVNAELVANATESGATVIPLKPPS